MPYAPLGGPADYLVVRAAALPLVRRAVAHADYGPMAVVFAAAEEALAQGALVEHRNTRGLDPTDGRWASAAEREQRKLTAWAALLADGERPGARLAAMTLAGLALGARRRLRGDRSRPLSVTGTGLALLRGYIAAMRRREQTSR